MGESSPQPLVGLDQDDLSLMAAALFSDGCIENPVLRVAGRGLRAKGGMGVCVCVHVNPCNWMHNSVTLLNNRLWFYKRQGNCFFNILAASVSSRN